jgi:hypothetical protein
MSDPLNPALPAARPSVRNPWTTWLVPMACFAAAPPLGGLLGTTAFRFAPNAAILAGVAITAAFTKGMIDELNSAAGSQLKFWNLFIPIYGIYWAAVLVPRQMAVAKQKANRGQPRGAVVYLFLFLYALAADLNDLARG